MNLLWKSFAVAALAALAGAPRSALASTALPVPADYGGVQRLDLSGAWDFQMDAKGEGEQARWFDGNAATGWGKLSVPGSFDDLLAASASSPAQAEATRFYQGAAWYRTRFATPVGPAKQGTECFLHLSGTVLRHTVWLNGQRVGQSNLPYLDTAYDVTALLKPGGTNSLVIEVNNSIEKRAIPDQNWHGWWDDGGLIRPVYLELRPSIHGQSYVSTSMLPGGGWNLAVDTQLQRAAPDASATVAYSLTDAAGKTVWKTSPQPISTGSKTAAPVPGVKAWSPDHPTLYTLRTSITAPGQADDVTSFRVGFRQIAVRGTQILLNGQPFVARGLSRHQFLPGAGMSLSAAQDRRDMQSIKALGANFVRLAHYSQSQDVYDACDELGLLVWTEIPAWQTARQTLADPAVWRDYAQPQLQQMVLQHRNHASVVVWSVANEIPSDTPDGAAYVAKAIAYVKTLDNTRLVTFASDRREKDLAFSSVDVIAINEYFGWYYGASRDVGPMLDDMHARFPQKPVLVTEFGDEGIAGWKKDPASTDSRDFSYAGQVTFLLDHLQQIFAPERRPFMAGGLIWLYNDFPDPHQTGKDRPPGGKFVNTKGLVTAARQPKPAYTAVQAYFKRLQTDDLAKPH